MSSFAMTVSLDNIHNLFIFVRCIRAIYAPSSAPSYLPHAMIAHLTDSLASNCLVLSCLLGVSSVLNVRVRSTREWALKQLHQERAVLTTTMVCIVNMVASHSMLTIRNRSVIVR